MNCSSAGLYITTLCRQVLRNDEKKKTKKNTGEIITESETFRYAVNFVLVKYLMCECKVCEAIG